MLLLQMRSLPSFTVYQGKDIDILFLLPRAQNMLHPETERTLFSVPVCCPSLAKPASRLRCLRHLPFGAPGPRLAQVPQRPQNIP